MWFFVAIIVVFSAAFVGGSAWLIRLLADCHADDTQGRDHPRSRGTAIPLWERLRAWLLKKPARLDYRRDERGRFRKVRRG